MTIARITERAGIILGTQIYHVNCCNIDITLNDQWLKRVIAWFRQLTRPPIRDDLIESIVEESPNDLETSRRGPRFRPRLKYRKTGLLVSVLIANCSPTQAGKLRWLVHPPRYERERLIVIAFLNQDNTLIERSLAFHNVPFKRTKVSESSEWLRSGIPLKQASDFVNIIREFRSNRGK
jgi:hypothetical protein